MDDIIITWDDFYWCFPQWRTSLTWVTPLMISTFLYQTKLRGIPWIEPPHRTNKVCSECGW
jgi:hypothetical protein